MYTDFTITQSIKHKDDLNKLFDVYICFANNIEKETDRNRV